MILVLIFGISASFATNVNQTDEIQKTTDDTGIVLSVNGDDTISSIKTNDSDDSILLESSSNEKLSASSGSFTDLDRLIRSSEGELILENDYVFSDSDSLLKIYSNNFILDFNGHIMDANQHSGTVIQIIGNNVTLKNIKFINAIGTSSNYPIVWSGDDGILDNMTLSDCNYGVRWTGINGLYTNSNINNIGQGYSLYSTGEKFKFTFSNVTDTKISGGDYCIFYINGFSSNISHINFKNIIFSNSNEQSRLLEPINSLMEYCNFINVTSRILISPSNTRHSHLYFENCTATNDRGVIMIYSSNVNSNIENSIFINCVGSTRIVWLNNPSSNLINCTFKNNKASSCVYTGGGLVSNCKFIENTVTNGVVRVNRVGGSLIQSSEFINNTASSNAGAIYAYDQTVVVKDCVFTHNTANNGGAIYLGQSKSSVSNSIFTNNIAQINGNGIFAKSNLNIKLNGTGNVWNESYESDVYAIGCYDETYDVLWVSQNGEGDGSDSDNPTTYSNALNKIALYGTIKFVPNAQIYTISSTITAPINLMGNGATITTNDFVFNYDHVSNVELNGFKFVNSGSTSVNAPVICYGYGITVSDCEFSGCTGKYSGAIYSPATSGSTDSVGLIIKNCNFTNNQATQNANSAAGAISFSSIAGGVFNCNFVSNIGVQAGAIAIYGYSQETRNLINCTFSKNQATGNGAGAILVNIPRTVISNCNFTDNSVKGTGAGAIKVQGNEFILINSKFNNNEATGSSGALYLTTGASDSIIDDCEFNNNKVSGDGAAVYSLVKVTVTDSKFNENNATNGGALYLGTSASNSVIDDCEFNNNKVSGDGAAVYSLVKVTVIDSNFYSNVANNGGALYLTVPSNIDGCEFDNNDANSNGGAIYASVKVSIADSKFNSNTATSGGAIYSDELTIDVSEFFNNKASTNGGAIYMVDDGSITGSIFGSNSAYDGGSIYAAGNNSLIMRSTLQNNTATHYGGAIYITDYCSYYVDKDSQLSYKSNTALSPTNDIYNMHATSLLGEVYIVLYPNSIDGNTYSGDERNPVNISAGLSKVAPGGSLIFMNQSEIYVSNGNTIINTNKEGIKFIGKNTTMKKYLFSINTDYFEIHNFIFTGCDDGAFVCTGANCLVKNCTFLENGGINCNNGSAIKVLGDNLTIENSNFINNSVGDTNYDWGGAVFINGSRLNIINCTFNGNSANYGAHLYVCENSSIITIERSRFLNAKQINFDGVGLLFNNWERITIRGNNFTSNAYGGAIRFNGDVVGLNMLNNNFINNKAISSGHAVNGGAICINNRIGSSTFKDNVFSNNIANNYGGAIYVASGDLNLNKNVFTGNRANLGGAIYTGARLSVSDSNFTSNSAVNGGAIYSTAALSVSGSKFTSNAASGTGGAIYMTASGSSIQDSTFSGNTANSYRNVYSTSVPTFAGNTIDASYTLNSISDATYPADVTITGTFDDGNNFASNVRITANGDEATTFSLTNSNSFSASWEDVIPGIYNVAVANTDANNNKFVYTTTPARSFTVSRRNVIYVGNTAGSPGYGLTASDPTTWDHVAEILAEGGTVYFTSGTYSNFYDKTVSGSWTLRSVDGATVVLDANNKGRIFTVSANNVKINGLTFKNGKVSNNQGSAIYWTGTGGSITNSVLTENTGTPISSSNTISISNSQMKNQITLAKSNINWGTTETITGTFAHNAPSTVNILFNGTSQGTYNVASGKVTASYAFTNPATRSVGSYVVTDQKNISKEVL